MTTEDLVAQLVQSGKITATQGEAMLQLAYPVVGRGSAESSAPSPRTNMAKGGIVSDNSKAHTVYRKGQGPFISRGSQRLTALGRYLERGVRDDQYEQPDGGRGDRSNGGQRSGFYDPEGNWVPDNAVGF